jgi:phosphohistidine phosphatase SixA
MKTLIVLRHAKAQHLAPDGTDIHRALSDRGERDAQLVGKTLRKLDLIPELILCSPATRTRETAERVLAKLKHPVPICLEEGIYEASVGSLIDLLSRQKSGDRLLLIGHNPGLEGLVGWLVRPDQPPHLSLPTAGVARIDFAMDDWSEITQTHGELAWFSSPDYLLPLD